MVAAAGTLYAQLKEKHCTIELRRICWPELCQHKRIRRRHVPNNCLSVFCDDDDEDDRLVFHCSRDARTPALQLGAWPPPLGGLGSLLEDELAASSSLMKAINTVQFTPYFNALIIWWAFQFL